MATHSGTLAWKIPWTERPSRLQFVGSQRVGHDWVTSLYNYICYITECIAHRHITHWAPVVFLCIGPGPSSAKRTWPHGTYRPFWAMLHGIPGFLPGKGKSRPSNKKQDGSPNSQYHRMCPHSETGSLHRWVKMMPLDIYMFVLFVWLCCVAFRILVPLPGTEPMPLQWKHQVLATRPWGKYQNDIFRLDSTLIRLVLLFKKKKKKKKTQEIWLQKQTQVEQRWCKDTQGQDGHLQARRRGLPALRRNQFCQHLDSDSQPPELRGNTFVLCKLPSTQHTQMVLCYTTF